MRGTVSYTLESTVGQDGTADTLKDRFRRTSPTLRNKGGDIPKTAFTRQHSGPLESTTFKKKVKNKINIDRHYLH